MRHNGNYEDSTGNLELAIKCYCVKIKNGKIVLVTRNASPDGHTLEIDDKDFIISIKTFPGQGLRNAIQVVCELVI